VVGLFVHVFGLDGCTCTNTGRSWNASWNAIRDGHLRVHRCLNNRCRMALFDGGGSALMGWLGFLEGSRAVLHPQLVVDIDLQQLPGNFNDVREHQPATPSGENAA
ncbi:unnamed protein product, partial [Ectocarpus sp. 12 AP-2014]